MGMDVEKTLIEKAAQVEDILKANLPQRDGYADEANIPRERL